MKWVTNYISGRLCSFVVLFSINSISEAWDAIPEHLYPTLFEEYIIFSLLGPCPEEFFHSTVQKIRFQSHETLQEGVSDEPADEHFISHEEAVGLENSVLAFGGLNSNSLAMGIKLVKN